MRNDLVHGTRQATDITIYDRDGRLKAAVEVKAIRDVDLEWARAYRNNLVTAGYLGAIEYFLLVTPRNSYLWSSGRSDEPGEPLVFETARILALFRSEDEEEELSAESLTNELVVGTWLSDLSHHPDEAPEELKSTGFVSLLPDSLISYEAAAA